MRDDSAVTREDSPRRISGIIVVLFLNVVVALGNYGLVYTLQVGCGLGGFFGITDTPEVCESGFYVWPWIAIWLPTVVAVGGALISLALHRFAAAVCGLIAAPFVAWAVTNAIASAG